MTTRLPLSPLLQEKEIAHANWLVREFVDGVMQLLSSLRLDEARSPGV